MTRKWTAGLATLDLTFINYKRIIFFAYIQRAGVGFSRRVRHHVIPAIGKL